VKFVNFNNQIRFQLTSLIVICIVVLIGFACFKVWPEKITNIDLEKTPFSGKSEADSFVNFSDQITDSTGRSRAHKFILIFLALIILFKPFIFDVSGQKIVSKNSFRLLFEVLKNVQFSRRFVFIILSGVFLFPLMYSFFLFPDFSKYSEADFAVTNSHYTVIVGQADLTLSGFKLMDDVNPTYGVIFPSLIAFVAKIQGKLLSLGGILRIVQFADIFYWFVTLFLFWKWGGKNWIYMIPAVLFMLPWHYSTDGVLIPINHSPIRTFGITFAILFLMVFPDREFTFFYLILGFVGGSALLFNVESGLASLIGIMAFIFVNLRNKKIKIFPAFKICLMFSIGFIGCFVFFNFAFFLLFGYFPTLVGWFKYATPALLGTSGAWTVPYKFDFWPIFIFLHVCFYFVINVISSGRDKKSSVRIMISVTFLVWFAYFVSRPDLEYLSSFYFIYGFMIIDLNRSLYLSMRRFPLKSFVSVLPCLISVFLLIKSSNSIEWSWNPLQWNVKNDFRWQVPLVKKGNPSIDDSVFYSRVYFPRAYWESLKMRGDFLAGRIENNPLDKLVFFSPDSYLLPRFSNIYPYQIFSDPIVALKKSNYLDMLKLVINSSFDEIYFDARDETKLIWYGWIFKMVRKDLSKDFEKVGVESGWEIWRRITPSK